MGQSLYVMGSIKELGEWKEFVCPLSWTEGHVWVTEEMVLDQAIFKYKYVLKEDNGATIWERGYDRIADLTLLENLNPMD